MNGMRVLARCCHALDDTGLIDGTGVETPIGFDVGIPWNLFITDWTGRQDAVVRITELDEHFPFENIEVAMQKTDTKAA